MAIEEVSKNQTKNYGIVQCVEIENSTDTFKVTDMVEKPDPEKAPTNLAIIGRYILTPDIFHILKKNQPDDSGEIQITDALKVQAKLGKVIAYKFKGKRFDCGSIDGYIKATNYFASKLINSN